MVIRRLSYLLDREPTTGGVRLRPAPAQESAPEELLERVERVIACTHRGIREPAEVLSYSRLPDGGSLLCNAVTGDAQPARRIEAVYLPSQAGGLEHVWPIDTWRSRSWEPSATAHFGEVDLLPGPEGHFDRELLVRFAQEQGARVAPFLADVRRLFEDPAGRQIVLVEHTTETVARWIALACASLPEAYARSLTFTTRTADPYGAPQQILGIGPQARFDRFDPVVLAHLYRVHDGIDRQGSPAVADPWAELTARLWIAGTPPQPAPGPRPAGDWFALPRLVSQVLSAETVPDKALAGLHDDTLRAVVAVLAAAAEQDGKDSAGIEELTRICRELDRTCPAAVVEPLAIALARSRVRAAVGHDAFPRPGDIAELPLRADARRTLRDEFGPRIEDGLRRRQRSPFTTWAGPLGLALALDVDAGPAVEDAVSRLARALLHPTRQECAEAVALLEDIDHSGLTRRVLERLALDAQGWKVRGLRELAASPHGDWLRRNLTEAPLPIRLAEAAERWSAPPNGLRGADLWAKLVELVPGGRVADARTLHAVWELTWPGGQPDRRDAPLVVRTCTPRLIAEAGLGVRLIPWLMGPDRFDPELVDFAREMLDQGRLGIRERATAELLVVAQDLADRAAPASRAIDRVRALIRQAAPLDSSLRGGVHSLIGLGLARADPIDLCGSSALDWLAARAKSELLRHYREAVLSDMSEARTRELLGKPKTVVALFVLWISEPEGFTPEWRQVADELLLVLGAVLQNMDDRQLREVANLVHRKGPDWVYAWDTWRDNDPEGRGRRSRGDDGGLR